MKGAALLKQICGGVLVLCATAVAQPYGVVRDLQGNPLSGVVVELASGFLPSQTVDDSGAWILRSPTGSRGLRHETTVYSPKSMVVGLGNSGTRPVSALVKGRWATRAYFGVDGRRRTRVSGQAAPGWIASAALRGAGGLALEDTLLITRQGRIFGRLAVTDIAAFPIEVRLDTTHPQACEMVYVAHPETYGCLPARAWDGLGFEWDPMWWFPGQKELGFDSAGWRTVLGRIDTIAPGPVRVMFQLRWFTSDPSLLTWDWSSQKVRSLLSHLDALKERGISVILCEWGFASNPSFPLKLYDSISDPRYAVGIASVLEKLVVSHGYSNIKWFSLGNEPDLAVRQREGTISWMKWVEASRAAIRERNIPVGYLASEELLATGLVDSSSLAMQDGAAVRGFHSYYPRTDLEYLLWQFPIPDSVATWLTEIGLPEGTSRQHPLGDDPIYGLELSSMVIASAYWKVRSALAWCLHDTRYDLLPDNPEMRWGMMKGPLEGMELKPWARSWALLSRAMPPGTKLVFPRTQPEGGRWLWSFPQGQRERIVLVNWTLLPLRFPFPQPPYGSWRRSRYQGTVDPGGGLVLPTDSVGSLGGSIVLPPQTMEVYFRED